MEWGAVKIAEMLKDAEAAGIQASLQFRWGKIAQGQALPLDPSIGPAVFPSQRADWAICGKTVFPDLARLAGAFVIKPFPQGWGLWGSARGPVVRSCSARHIKSEKSTGREMFPSSGQHRRKILRSKAMLERIECREDQWVTTIQMKRAEIRAHETDGFLDFPSGLPQHGLRGVEGGDFETRMGENVGQATGAGAQFQNGPASFCRQLLVKTKVVRRCGILRVIKRRAGVERIDGERI